MADFVAQLDRINALAEVAPGFVWRLKADGGGASSYIQVFDDPRIIANMSLWESVEALHAFTYRSAHLGIFKDRHRWFEPPPWPTVVLWWVPAGHVPTLEEGRGRWERLVHNGPIATAFTFKRLYGVSVPLRDEERSPAESVR